MTIWRLEPPASTTVLPSETIYGIGRYNKLDPTARALRSVAPSRSSEDDEAGMQQVQEMAIARDGVKEYYRILDKERDVGIRRLGG